METIIKEDNGCTIVSFVGRLDTTSAPTTEKELKPLMDLTGAQVVIDCSRLTYISSSGLRIFITLQKHFMKTGGQMTVKSLLPEIKAIFDLTGFSNILMIM